jgi:hypothetical protein
VKAGWEREGGVGSRLDWAAVKLTTGQVTTGSLRHGSRLTS